MTEPRSVNAPLPHQLTVGTLLAALEGVHEQAVICVELPLTDDYFLTVLRNLKVKRAGSPVVVLELSEAD